MRNARVWRNDDVKPLTQEQELELVRRWREEKDPAAMQEIVMSHYPLCWQWARIYRRGPIPMEDLVNEGMLGLIDALERFDVTHETRFSTYARWWVRYYMQRYVAWNRHATRAPSTRNGRRTREQMGKAVRKLSQQLSRLPTEQEIADELEVPVDEVARVRAWWGVPPVAIDGTDAEDDGFAGQNDEARLPESIVHEARLTEKIRRKLEEGRALLNEREWFVIEAHLVEGLPFRTIGDQMGISGERVRQIEAAGLGKLRKVFAKEPQLVAAIREELCA